MNQKHPLIQGTLILTFASILSRLIGFYNRIFLSRVIGAKELGIYQMIFPVYLLCFAICCQGFEIGLSQIVAAQKACSNHGNIRFLLKTTIFLCFSFSILLMVMIFFFSDWISVHLFAAPSAGDCLKIAALALPFVAVKESIHGYYVGCSNSSIPAASQLIEQITRVTIIFLIASTVFYVKFPGAKLAVVGMTAGEIISCLFNLSMLKKEKLSTILVEDHKTSLLKEFFHLSLPLSANRICLTLLQSIEAILIPGQMMFYYCDRTLSLELYGILTGITLPFLFFPSTLTNSLATMLLPAVAADFKQQDYAHLNRTISFATYTCFFLGLFFLGFFFLCGPAMGNFLFHNAVAGQYLKVLSFLCPALYLSAIFTSILNGMGKTNRTFFHNILSIFTRLFFIFLFVPRFGINGYIWGILVSTFLLVFFNYLFIQKMVRNQN